MKAHKKRMKIVSILLAFALITQTIPAELFRFFVSWVSAEEIQLPQQDSYVIPQESPVNLEIEIPPTFVEGEDYVPAEEEITIPDSSEIASTDDDIRYGTILQTYTAYSQLSSEDAAFFVEYTGVSASDFTTMETGGLNLSRSVKYGMLAGAFGCELSKIMEIAPTQTEYNDLYRQITIYHSAIRVELLSEAQNATIKDYILEGYSCNEVCNAVVVNEITGIPVNQLLSDETAQVPSGTSPAVLNASTNFANKFSVSPNAVVNNAAENDWSTDDAQGYQEDVDSRLAQIKGVTSTGSETPPEGEEGAVQDPFLGAPYVYSENDTEQISFNTGSLSYTQVDYILPGINGLDLTIGRRYQSQDASIYTPYLDYDMVETDKYMVIFLKTVTRYPGGDMDNGILDEDKFFSRKGYYLSLRSAQRAIERWESSSNQKTDQNGDVVVTEYWTTEPVLVTVEEEEYYSTTIPNSYNKDLYGLGHGWSFLFSSIESGRYLHLSDGSCYMTDFYGSSPSHLKDYTLTDKVMDRDCKEFTNGSVNSYYRLTYQDGRKEYFSSNGKLIGICDRYGNSIKLTHSTQNGYPRITIVDTLNRTTVISGASSENGHVMTVSLPDQVSLTYEVAHYDSSTQSIASYTDPVGRTTHYSYTVSGAGFDIQTKWTGGAVNYYLNLTTVTHPTLAQTVYTYVRDERNLENDGLAEVYKLASREDREGEAVFNHIDYTYSSDDCSGYPSYQDPDSLPAEFTYWTKATNSGGLGTTAVFDYHNLNTGTVMEQEEIKLQETLYQYNDDRLPVRSEARSYSTQNQNSPIVSVVLWEYDEKGNITGEWSPLAEGDSTDTLHKTSYTYDSVYGLLLSKIYLSNENTEIRLQNTLDEAAKNVIRTELYGNDFLKSRTDYTYDSYGNLTSEKKYHDNFADYDLTEFSYQDNAYLSLEKHNGVVSSDGTPAISTPGQAAGTVALSYSYDLLGRLINAADGNGNVTSYTYDALGKVLTVTNPDGTTVSYQRNYSQNTVVVIDENGASVKYSYTPLGLELETIDSLTGNVISRKEYDSLSRLSRKTEYVYGSVTEYTYDILGRVLSETVNDSYQAVAQTSYTYDDAAENGLYQKVTKTIEGDESSPSIITTQYTDAYGRIAKTGRVSGGVEYFDTYTYDYLGNVLTHLSAAGAERNLPFSEKYEYNETEQVVKSYNAGNQFTVNSYNALGQLVSASDYSQNLTVYSYDALGRLLSQEVTVEEGETSISRYDYDPAGNLIREWKPSQAVGSAVAWEKTEYAYDSRRRLSSVSQYDGDTLSGVTRYTYDGIGNTLTVATGLSSPEASGGSTTVYTYDRFGNVLTMTDPMGQSESYSYSQLGRPVSKTDRMGRQTDYGYDVLGRLCSLSDAEDNNTVWIYSKTGKLQKEQNQWHKTEYLYNGLGQMASVTETQLEAAPKLTYYTVTLDPAGGTISPVSMQVSPGGTCVLSTPVRPGYTFDGWYQDGTLVEGSALVQVNADITVTAHWTANTYTVTLDTQGGSVLETSVLAVYDNEYTLPEPVRSGYTFAGWYLGENQIQTGDTVQILADSVFTAHWTANTYTVTLNPDGGTVSSTTVTAVYGAPVILPAAEKEGYIFEGWYLGDTQYASGGIYEIAGNVTLTAHWEEEFSGYVVTLNPGGGTVSPAELEVEPGDTYTLPVPIKTGYTFAGWYLGESQIQTGDTVELEADAVFTAHWTANSYTIVFHGNGGNYFFDTEQTQACVYDQDVTLNGNQFTRLFYAFEGWSTTETGTVEYTDQQSGLRNLTAEANGQFHLYAVWRNTWEWSSAESPAMLTSLEEEPLLTYTKAYTYDLAGNRTGMTVSVGGQTAQTVTYTYDDLNRLTGVSEDGTLKAAYTYDTNGNRQSLTYANGVVESYSYNKANWVTSVVNQKDGEVLSSYTYTYYAGGNQKSKTDHTGKTTSYEYDGLGRLTLESEAGGITASYVYDLKGNRLSLTVTGTESYTTAYSYDANNRLLSETRTESGESVVTTYTYDSNGNLLTESTPAHGEESASNSSYVYDDMDRLVKATVNGVVAFYTYNPSGIRTSKRIGGGTAVNYLLDGGDVIGESENGVITAEYLRGINLILGGEGYYLYNAHGDVVGLTDESGEVTKAYDYDAFGNEKELNANDQNPFRYCGEYFDPETGTYYLRARYYDPAIGRFTQEDTHWNVANRIYGDNPQILYEHQDAFGLVIYSYIPNIIAVMQSGNSYLYCLGNPSTFIDNNGYFINTIIGGITGGVVGGFMAAMTGGDFSSGFISGAVSGAVSGFGVDVAVAFCGSGIGLICVPILGAAGGALGNYIEQALDDPENIDPIEIGISAGTGAVFNVMSYGLAVLSSSAFGSVPRGNTVMEKMVNSVVDSTVPENTLSAWMSTNFVELPQAVTNYTINQSRSKQQPAVVNTAEQNKVNKKKTNSYSKKNNKNQIRY